MGCWKVCRGWGWGSMRHNSADILLQSFLWEAIISSSGMGRDVHSLVLSIHHFLVWKQCRQPSKVPWRMVLEAVVAYIWMCTGPALTDKELLEPNDNTPWKVHLLQLVTSRTNWRWDHLFVQWHGCLPFTYIIMLGVSACVFSQKKVTSLGHSLHFRVKTKRIQIAL